MMLLRCGKSAEWRVNIVDLFVYLYAHLGSLFIKRNDKSRTQEEMALQVAQMIINEITKTTQGEG